MHSPTVSHRHSFSNDHLRGIPTSPRSSRHFPHSSGVTDLLNNPPKQAPADPAFEGRDWHDITVDEIADKKAIIFVEVDTGIEEATNSLIASHSNVLLVRHHYRDRHAIGTFDYKDLNQYLLFATGALIPDDEHIAFFKDLASRAHRGAKIPLRDVKALGAKEPFVTLSPNAKLTQLVEIFGGGVHRVIVTKPGTNEVVGMVSQMRLIKFLWENVASFPILEQLLPEQLGDLKVGALNPICINGDKPLREALLQMDGEGITSLAVVDNQRNVVGNISTVDVRLLTMASSAPLLSNTCIHFISVILSSRGMEDGKDSVPVFHVSPYSTLAHTVAKLVATRSHRMWIVDSPSPSVSGPPTPQLPPSVPVPPQQSPPAQALPPFQPTSHSPSISASAIPGAHMSGRLTGVISLTDILNLFARKSGLSPNEPSDWRRHRRRSSSSSLVRGSMDSARSSSISVDNIRR